jgi:hypothetical protein
MSGSGFQNPPDSEIFALLKRSKRIAVVGMSSNPERASHDVAKYLLSHGYEIIPVNPMESEILGRKSYASLNDIPGHIDIVDVFRRSDQTDAVIDESIKLKPEGIWLQLGVINDSGATRAKQAGLTVIQDRCIKIEHARM